MESIISNSEIDNNLFDKLHEDFQSRRTKEKKFWEHVTLIYATTISFSTIFFSGMGIQPNIFIIISLCLMVFGILLGLFLISESIYFTSRQRYREAIIDYNKKMIKEWSKSGKITYDLENYLSLANIFDAYPPTKKLIKKSPKFYKFVEECMEGLPSKKIFNQGKYYLVKQWFIKLITSNFNKIITVFYFNAFISFLLLLLGLLTKE